MRASFRLIVLSVACTFSPIVAAARGQATSGPLTTRAELMALAASAESAAHKGEGDQQQALLAAAIRQRLRDGDMQVGDRVVVTIVSDAVHKDTVVVRSGRTLQLMGVVVVPLSGVLRSELQDRVSTEVLKYVKASQIEVTPLLRVGVLGAVARPGFFAFASDIPLTDAIMGAGGPIGTADLSKTTVRRQNQEFRTAAETSKAINRGLTLDQFGLSAGDEVIVGQRREFGLPMILAVTGAITSLLTISLALQHR